MEISHLQYILKYGMVCICLSLESFFFHSFRINWSVERQKKTYTTGWMDGDLKWPLWNSMAKKKHTRTAYNKSAYRDRRMLSEGKQIICALNLIFKKTQRHSRTKYEIIINIHVLQNNNARSEVKWLFRW